MTTKRKAPACRGDRRGRPEGATATKVRGPADASPSRRNRRQGGTTPASSREPRQSRSRPQNTQNTAAPRTDTRKAAPKNAKQAKARAKARKAKAPKVVRVPLRERLILRLASVDLRPRTLAAKVPFVVLIIGSLGVGLGITLWLSTDAAERSYQLGNIREQNRVLLQQKEALERDVLQAQSAPELAEAARNLGMIPSRDTAHLVQDPVGNWVVVGSPKPAEGAPPPPLNTKLPDEHPAKPPLPPGRPGAEVPVRVSPGGTVAPTAPGLPGLAPDVPLNGVPAPGLMPAAPGLMPAAPGLMPAAPGLAPTGPLPGPAPMALPDGLSETVTAPQQVGGEQFGPASVATTPGLPR